jgi:hypothetical protein
MLIKSIPVFTECKVHGEHNCEHTKEEKYKIMKETSKRKESNKNENNI